MAAARDVIFKNRRRLASGVASFSSAGLFGGDPLGHQESVGRNVRSSVVVEPPPAATFVRAQAEVLLQVLVVALDAPMLMGDADQLVDRRLLGQRRRGDPRRTHSATFSG